MNLKKKERMMIRNGKNERHKERKDIRGKEK